MQTSRTAAQKLFEQKQQQQSDKAQTFSLNLEAVRKLREQTEQHASKTALDDELESTYQQQQQKKNQFVPKTQSITAKRVCEVLSKPKAVKQQENMQDATRRTFFERQPPIIKTIVKTPAEMSKMDDTLPIPVPADLIQKIANICIEFEKDEQDVNKYLRRKRHEQILAKESQQKVQLHDDVSIFDDDDAMGDYVCEVDEKQAAAVVEKQKMQDNVIEPEQQVTVEQNPEVIKLRQQVEEAKRKQEELVSKYKTQEAAADPSGYGALYRRGEEVDSWISRDKDALRQQMMEDIAAEQEQEKQQEQVEKPSSSEKKTLTWETSARDKQMQRDKKPKTKNGKDKLKRDYDKISGMLKSQHNMDLERPQKKQKRE